MAYAAVVSLRHIIEQLSPSHQLSIPYPNCSPIQSLRTKICSLQAFLKEQNTVDDVHEAQIRDALYAAEDTIESHISSHLRRSAHQYDGSSGDEIISEWLKLLDPIEDMAANMADQKSSSRIVRFSSRSSTPADETIFVGNKDGLSQMKDQLVGESPKLKVVSVVGMAGVGKTTLVKRVYSDLSIEQFFHYRALAIIGPNYQRRDVIRDLLKSVDHRVPLESNEEIISDAQLTESLYKNLKGRRYLIVLDDLCDMRAWDDLKSLFPDDGNGSRIMLTTRMRKVALYAAGTSRNVHQIRFLDKDESWKLLDHLVFFPEECPPNLLKTGKAIAQNCQGLPLTIVLLGEILKQAEKTQEYWKRVADSLTSAVQSHDVGLTSVMQQFLKDEHLPQHLKACFQYMGAFPLSYEIPTTRLIQLWVAEGFLEPKDSKSLEEVAEECLEELVDRSLVLIHKSRSTSGGIKTCSVHSAVWHLCVNAAEKDMFFHALNRITTSESECSDIENSDIEASDPQDTISSRRLCVRKNVLFGIEDVKTIASVSTVRSLLCIGPEHLHPLRVYLEFRLLRVLNALTVCFFNFPDEILELLQLRFLALTFNGEYQLPSSICKLLNLQFLIVRQHLNIKTNGSAPSYLPVEIWDMKQLRHLQIMGGDLMQPDGDALLENLLTLSDVSGHSCTKGVLERTPNLKKLGIRIELAEIDDSSSLLHLFDHLPLLFQLESFKCIIMNPDHGSSPSVISRPNSVSDFPSTLKKLTLSGCGFPWEDMKIFAHLPNLEALKLLCNAFQGTEWKIDEGEFKKLKFLLLEDLDIENWISHGQILRILERLTIRHCYKLQEIPGEIDYITTLQMLEVVDCSPSVVDSALRVKEMQEDLSNDDIQVRIESSWKEKARN